VEQYECSDCCYKGYLNTHGRCARCGSDAVMSMAKLTFEILSDLFTHDELQVLFGLVCEKVGQA